MKLNSQLMQAGWILDIDLIDHIIIGCTEADHTGLGDYSFSDPGKIL
jgi:DNA repair protein RadC